MQQFRLSSLDELSTVIAKEGSELLQGAVDDGTFSCLVSNLLYAAREVHLGKDAAARSDIRMAESDIDEPSSSPTVPSPEPLLASLRRSAFKSCIAVSMHKMTLAAVPIVTGLMHMAPN